MFFLEASKHPELDADVEAEGSHHVEADVEVFRSAEALDLVAEKIRLLTTASQGPVGRALAQHPGSQESTGFGLGPFSLVQAFL